MRCGINGIAAALLLVVLLLAGLLPAAGAEGAEGKKRGAKLSALEEDVRRGINRIRQERNLPPLAANRDLARLAREYSRRMAEEGFFAHYDPSGASVVDRLREAGISFRVAGENIFSSRNLPDPVQAAIDGWMASPGHRENILRPEFRETGVGIWKEGETFYITQIFLKSP